ncbi:MAG: MATE family efflux transporter, partial [Clostridiales bacterium]|nr:MATE family efflux transporter [Clostridiales bacterium]
MITDLTEGNISRKLWAFSIPMLISVIFQQLYNIADSVIAGKYIGEDALAAVGASYPISMMFMAVAIGSNIGCSVVVSQLFGGKMYKEMKTAITTTFITVGALSVLLTVMGLLLSDNLIRMINTPDNIFKDAYLYISIYMGGLVFLFLYNVCTGIFNALGDSKTPLYFLVGSSLGNIFMDWLFVAVFGMGVDGVAWATFICQGIAGVLSLITLIIRL